LLGVPPSRSWSVSHSQIVTTCQPWRRSAAAALRSRQTFAMNFFAQNDLFDLGLYANLQPGWRCQKQPWTNMAVLYRGSTISGLPGRDFLCRRNLKPFLWRKVLTRRSGPVFAARMRDIFQLRCTFEIRSDITVGI